MPRSIARSESGIDILAHAPGYIRRRFAAMKQEVPGDESHRPALAWQLTTDH
jgi:hypothetical protein